MYKIVTTVENGLTNVTCVTSNWIKGFTLYWSPKKHTIRKIVDLRANCVPPEANWQEIKCIPRKTGPINTFKDGLEWESLITKLSDTDDEERYFLMKKQRRLHPESTVSNSWKENYNLEMVSLSQADVDDANNNNNNFEEKTQGELGTDVPPEGENIFILTDETLTDQQQFVVSNTICEGNSSDIYEKLPLEEMVPSLIQENQALQHNIEVLIKSNSEINIKVDKLLTIIGNQQQTEKAISKENTYKTDHTSAEKFVFPLTTVEAAKNLDNCLSDKAFMETIKECIGNVGKNDGEVDGYFLNKIGHQIFTDELLNKYTFKGIGRKGQQKECFSELKNILCLLQKTCYPINKSFDDRRTSKYIQSKLLRHSGSRLRRHSNLKNESEQISEKTVSDDSSSIRENIINTAEKKKEDD